MHSIYTLKAASGRRHTIVPGGTLQVESSSCTLHAARQLQLQQVVVAAAAAAAARADFDCVSARVVFASNLP